MIDGRMAEKMQEGTEEEDRMMMMNRRVEAALTEVGKFPYQHPFTRGRERQTERERQTARKKRGEDKC